MTALQDFVGKISKVSGVRGFILLKRDGQILSQNMRIPDKVSAMAVICGLSSESLVTATGLSRFRCLVLVRGKKEKLLLFPAMQFFLLVIERPDTYTLELLKEIEGAIQTSIPF
jgi:predicted regulator of Ras-like GTPase activity (Roadblock/LC7/MglB family)